MDDSWMLPYLDELETFFGMPQKAARIANYRIGLSEHAIVHSELERGVRWCRDNLTRFPSFKELLDACRPIGAAGPMQEHTDDKLTFLRKSIAAQQWVLDRLVADGAVDYRTQAARNEIARLEGIIDRSQQFSAAKLCGVPEEQAARDVWGEKRNWDAPVGPLDGERRRRKSDPSDDSEWEEV